MIIHQLICKTYYIILHMNTACRTLMGKPKIEVPKPAQAHPSYDKIQLPGSLQNLGDLRQNFAELNLKAIAIGLAVLVLGGGLYWLVNRPGESLEDRTRLTAERFAADDLAFLKEIGSSDPADDVGRWFDS